MKKAEKKLRKTKQQRIREQENKSARLRKPKVKECELNYGERNFEKEMDSIFGEGYCKNCRD